MLKRNAKGHFIKGSEPYWKGKKFPDWYRKKLSDAHKKLNAEGKNLPPDRTGVPPANKGIPLSVVTKKKISERLKGKSNSSKGKPRYEQRGENHPFWNGGQKRYYHLCSRVEYKKWRTAVFERDDYTCQKCGKRGVYLEAHHLKSWVDYPKLRYVTSNGQTLCKPCHKETENYAGKGRRKKVYF